jgi:hypothetical protein
MRARFAAPASAAGEIMLTNAEVREHSQQAQQQ